MTAEAETLELPLHPDDAFLIAATDGLWDRLRWAPPCAGLGVQLPPPRRCHAALCPSPSLQLQLSPPTRPACVCPRVCPAQQRGGGGPGAGHREAPRHVCAAAGDRGAGARVGRQLRRRGGLPGRPRLHGWVGGGYPAGPWGGCVWSLGRRIAGCWQRAVVPPLCLLRTPSPRSSLPPLCSLPLPQPSGCTIRGGSSTAVLRRRGGRRQACQRTSCRTHTEPS